MWQSGLGLNITKKKVFFFEKKNQKTFIPFGRHRMPLCNAAAARQE
jgi:hypothetical protein